MVPGARLQALETSSPGAVITKDCTMAQRTFETEKDVKAEVKKLLTKHGVFLAIETKFGSKRPTPAQIGYLESIHAENGFGFVVNEKLLGDLDVWLTLFERATWNVQNEIPVTGEDQRDLMNAAAAMMQLISHKK